VACFLLQGLLAAQLHGDAMVRKKSHLYIKTNILPRQARDKHRENSKKMSRFSQAGIHADKNGAYSIVKAGGYSDDDDHIGWYMVDGGNDR
jgi:hypothetical protein